MIEELNEKDANIENITEKVLKDEKLISELVENLKLKEETIRYNSFKVLLQITEQKPKLLYSHWDFLEEMLEAKNTFWRSSVFFNTK